MRSTRRGSLAVAVLVIAATFGAACGGTQPTDPNDVESSSTETATNDEALGELTPEQFSAEWNDRLELSAEFDRAVVTALAEAAGITELLGGDAEASVSALLESSTAAIHAEWRMRGIDPAAAEAALSAPPPAVSSFRARDAASASSAGSAGSLALVTSMMSVFEPIFSQAPDPATGHITDRVSLQASAPASSGSLTITLDQTADVDLNMCPDASGLAEGVVTIDADMMATGTVDGEAVSLRAAATYTITTEVQSDAHAGLASAGGSLTGTIVSSGTDGDTTHADADGIGATVPYGEDGDPVASGIEGHGSTSGTASTIDDLSNAFMRAATILGVVHGQSALSHWSSGSCIRLEAVEPIAPLVGEATDIDVRAVHQIDGADVSGTLTVTPTQGTFDPLEGDAPATIHVIPDEGAAKAVADVQLRSLRGIATTVIDVDARGFHVALGDTLTISGDKCDGYVGLWPLIFAGTVSEQGVSIVFTGTLDITVNADLSATYTIDVRGEAEGLPMVTAALSFVGGGAAQFIDDPDAPRIDFLDGELATVAQGSGPGVSISGVITEGPAGRGAIPVTRSACATPPAG